MLANYRHLICMHCVQYLEAPVMRCYWCGLDMCQSCTNLYEYCPRCYSNKHVVKNFILNRNLTWMLLPCRRSCCLHVTKARYIRKHEATCLHRRKVCPLRESLKCKWKGKTKNQLMRHCREIHSEKVVITSQHVFEIPFKRNLGSDVKKHCFMFFDAYCELFQVYQCYDFKEREIKWKVCYNSERENRGRYIFEVLFDDYLEVLETLKLQAPCQILRTQEFFYVDFLKVRFDQVEDYCFDNHLYYRIAIRIV